MTTPPQQPGQPSGAQPNFARPRPGPTPTRAPAPGTGPGQQPPSASPGHFAARYGNAFQPPPGRQALMKNLRTIALIVLPLLLLIPAAVYGLQWLNRSQHEEASQVAVLGLLGALQSGRATEALSHLDEAPDPGDQPLLSDEALSANPDVFTFNTQLSLVESGNNDHLYRASVRINAIDKVVEWSVVRADGQWLVDADDVLHQVTINSDLPHLINGVMIPQGTSELTVLPGTYAAESGMALLGYGTDVSSFDVFTGGTSQFSTDLVMASGLHDQVTEQVRTILNGCAAEKSVPTACNWVMEFDNGKITDGSVTWELVPADPAANITLPTGPWTISNGFTATFRVIYQTSASGEGVIDDGSPGYFEDVVVGWRTPFALDLSGDEPVVTLS